MTASPARKMPVQKPGRSIQTYATPEIFIAAVKARFKVKEFAYDLAADADNSKGRHHFCEEEDSLSKDWTKLTGDLWLNPPFGHIDPWAEKCKLTHEANHLGHGSLRNYARIFFLTPASVGTNWFRDHVHAAMRIKDSKPRAIGVRVFFLNGRLCFDGKDPYPKDCMLTIFGVHGLGNGYEVWNWRKS
jgi:phage N-6-adenine-methyltransferase